jgi:hypothetical protein
MKKLARFLSAVLVLAMVVSLVPAASANAAKNYIFISGTKTQVSTEKKLTMWVGGKAVNLDYMINKKSAGISGTWKSSKPSVIKIDKATGEMKALKNGGVVITFKAKNGTKLKAGVYARTRATALNINSNGENVNAKELTLKVGEVLPVSIDMPVNKTALQSGSASSYKVYPEVEDTSVVQVIKSSNTEYKINAAKEGTTKVNFVANYSKEANVRKNKYYKENYVTIKVESDVAEGAKQTAVNQITVTGKGLTNVVADYAVKCNGAPIALASAVLSSDGKSVVLTTNSANPMAGSYTVTLKSGKVYELTMAQSGPSKIEFGKAATIVTGNSKQVKITYKILDQFGTDVTAKYYSAATITVNGYTVDKTKAGVIIATSTTDFVAGLTVVAPSVIAISGSTVASDSKSYTVSAAAGPHTVKLLGIYKLDGSNHVATSLMEGDVTANQVYLALEVRDQYGDLFPVASITKDNVIVSVVGATGLAFDTTTKPVALKANGAEFAAGYPVKAGKILAGTSTVTAVPVSFADGRVTGSGTITVTAATKVSSISNISQLATLKVGSKTEFSFTAYDNNNQVVTSYDLLKNVNFSMSQGITMKWEKQSNGTAKLYGTPSTQYGSIIAQPPALGAQITSQTFTAYEKAYPYSVLGIKSDASLGAVKGGTINVPFKYIKVQNQYGEEMTTDEVLASFASGYGFEITFGSNTAAVANAGSNGTPANGDATFIGAAALASGSNSVNIAVTKGGKAVAGSDYQTNLQCVELSELSNFKIEVPTLVYGGGGAATNLPISVYGTAASTGNKIKLKDSDYTVVLRPGTVAGTIENPGTDGKTGDNEYSVEYMIVVSDAVGSPDIKFTVNYSEKARVATTCELKSGAYLKNNTTYTAAQILAMFDFKDQYGDAIAVTGSRVTITGTTKNATLTNNGTATTSVKDADVTLTVIFTVGTQTFSRTITVY